MERRNYKIENWGQYNEALNKRGHLNLWVAEKALEQWFAPSKKKIGRPLFYSDNCVLLALTLRSCFFLPLRATQGLMEELLALMELDLPIPHYSRLCRRAKTVKIHRRAEKGHGALDVVVDSRKLQVFGEGQRKTRPEGENWRKFLLEVDPQKIAVNLITL